MTPAEAKRPPASGEVGGEWVRLAHCRGRLVRRGRLVFVGRGLAEGAEGAAGIAAYVIAVEVVRVVAEIEAVAEGVHGFVGAACGTEVAGEPVGGEAIGGALREDGFAATDGFGPVVRLFRQFGESCFGLGLTAGVGFAEKRFGLGGVGLLLAFGKVEERGGVMALRGGRQEVKRRRFVGALQSF